MVAATACPTKGTKRITDLVATLAPILRTSDITTKFFKATISGAGSCSTGPCYVLSVQRQTTNGSVADRYGTYTLTCNVPNAPAVTSANGNVQNELLK